MADVIDSVMVFRDRLTQAEAAELLTSTTPLGGLPTPEGRLVWYAPLDGDTPTPTGAAQASGRRATAAADSLGLTRWIGWLRNGPTDVSPFSAQLASATTWEVAVGLATSGTDDTAAAQHAQFAAETAQHTRVR